MVHPFSCRSGKDPTCKVRTAMQIMRPYVLRCAAAPRSWGCSRSRCTFGKAVHVSYREDGSFSDAYCDVMLPTPAAYRLGDTYYPGNTRNYAFSAQCQGENDIK